MKRIRKGDKVRIISGKNATKEGTVLAVYPKQNTALVEGVNKVKKHKKPTQANDKGGIIEEELPINLSKIALLDPKTKGAITKVTYVLNKEKKKVRRSKTSQVDFGGK